MGTKFQEPRMRYIINSVPSGPFYITEFDLKLNYNCPDSEKTGSGKGSCGGSTKSNTDDKQKEKASNKKKSSKISKSDPIPNKTSFKPFNPVIESNLDYDDLYDEAMQEIEPGDDMDEYDKEVNDYINNRMNENIKQLNKIKKAITFDHSNIKREIKVPEKFMNDKTANDIIEKGIKLIGSELVENVPMGRYIDEYTVNSKAITDILIEHPDDTYEYNSMESDLKKLSEKHPKWDNDDVYNELTGRYGNSYIINGRDTGDIADRNAIVALDHYIGKSEVSGPMKVYSGISLEYAKKLPKDGNFKTVTFMSASLERQIADEFTANRNEGKSNEKYVLEINLKAGDKALSTYGFYKQNIPTTTYNLGAGEKPVSEVHEVILPRQKEYRITGRRKEGKTNIITIDSV